MKTFSTALLAAVLSSLLTWSLTSSPGRAAEPKQLQANPPQNPNAYGGGLYAQAWGQMGYDNPEHANVVTARTFVLVDKDGKERLRLGIVDDSPAFIQGLQTMTVGYDDKLRTYVKRAR